jgi:hypothetical protein
MAASLIDQQQSEALRFSLNLPGSTPPERAGARAANEADELAAAIEASHRESFMPGRGVSAVSDAAREERGCDTAAAIAASLRSFEEQKRLERLEAEQRAALDPTELERQMNRFEQYRSQQEQERHSGRQLRQLAPQWPGAFTKKSGARQGRYPSAPIALTPTAVPSPTAAPSVSRPNAPPTAHPIRTAAAATVTAFDSAATRGLALSPSVIAAMPTSASAAALAAAPATSPTAATAVAHAATAGVWPSAAPVEYSQARLRCTSSRVLPAVELTALAATAAPVEHLTVVGSPPPQPESQPQAELRQQHRQEQGQQQAVAFASRADAVAGAFAGLLGLGAAARPLTRTVPTTGATAPANPIIQGVCVSGAYRPSAPPPVIRAEEVGQFSAERGELDCDNEPQAFLRP